ncbi:MAG: hypothetical protein WH035_01215, partial [Spirochaetota bacterium]
LWRNGRWNLCGENLMHQVEHFVCHIRFKGIKPFVDALRRRNGGRNFFPPSTNTQKEHIL